MTSLLSDCTWLEKEWKFGLSTTWHPSLHFYFFLSLDSSLSYLSCHYSFLFLIFFFHSFILICLFFFTFLYFSSFFLFHTHTFLLIFLSLDNFSKLSTPLFLTCIQSEILIKHARDETKLLKVGCVQGMLCTKEIYRVGYGIRRCTRLPR
jgi:hypothetical protein